MNPIHLAAQAASLAGGAMAHAQAAVAPHANLAGLEGAGEAVAPFVFLFAIFLMACFVGYYVIWNVTPALHSPLMALTNGISSVIIVGAMLATGLAASGWAVGF